MKTQEIIKPEHFYARIEEEWKVMGKCDRIEGMS